MFFKITLLIIILIIFYLFLDISIKRENFSNKKKITSQKNSILNFIAYPNKQPFCLNLTSSKAKYWSKLPKEYGKGLYMKYCCTGCYYKICKIINCSKNKDGIYKISKFTKDDTKNLEKYYNNLSKNNNNNNSKKLKFEFNKNEINKVIGKYVLKFKEENVYYPIQILKKKKDMDYKDVISTRVIEKEFNCKKKKKN